MRYEILANFMLKYKIVLRKDWKEKKMNQEKISQRTNINCDVRKNGKHLENMKYKAFNTNIYYIFLAFLYR